MSDGDIRHVIDRARDAHRPSAVAVFSTFRRGEYECVFADTARSHARIRDDNRFLAVVHSDMTPEEIREALQR